MFLKNEYLKLNIYYILLFDLSKFYLFNLVYYYFLIYLIKYMLWIV